jgi:hypothetical protein
LNNNRWKVRRVSGETNESKTVNQQFITRGFFHEQELNNQGNDISF